MANALSYVLSDLMFSWLINNNGLFSTFLVAKGSYYLV